MKRTHTAAVLGLMALAGGTSLNAMAQDSGWYIGGNAGGSHAKIDDDRIRSGLLGGGFTSTTINDDNHGFSYKVFGGYKFMPYFAMEGGYFDLGKFGFNATTVPAGTYSGEIKLRGVNLDAVGILPFTDHFSAFARVGVQYARAEDHFSGTGAAHVLNPDRSKRAANVKAGAGLEYDFTPNVGMRAELERYRIDDAVGNKGDIDVASLGLVVRFGGPAEPAPRPAPPPPPVEKADVADDSAQRSLPVAPPPPPPPPRYVPKKVTFSADSLFAFDRADINPAGRKQLDELAADLKGAQYDTIMVTGHSDRIGSHSYNMALSSRRAEAVKNYLVMSAGIPADRITARGVDGSEPVTKAGECPATSSRRGSKQRAQLIACLQPDRRVEVEVNGTK